MPDEHDDGYAGPGLLSVDGLDVAVQMRLAARHEPHDGRLHWFGRLTLDEPAAAPDLVRALRTPTRRIELRTPDGCADAQIGDVDPWGRYRVTGVGTPPFALGPPPDD